MANVEVEGCKSVRPTELSGIQLYLKCPSGSGLETGYDGRQCDSEQESCDLTPYYMHCPLHSLRQLLFFVMAYFIPI